ncbi:MAG: tetratricopeptide repeat protein, partial [Bacteroidota bacterium]|nr:tetratricopeptide repeat protein [Bacteroidota bacterium]
MRNVVKWAVACLAVLCFALGPAQTPQPDPARTRATFQEAWHVYLQSYSAATDSEEKALSRKALQLFKTLLPAIPKTAGIYDSILFRTQYTIGELEHYFKNLPGALQHYEAAVALRSRTNLPDSFFFKPLIFSGIIHYHQNQLDGAAKLFLQAEEIQNRYAVPLEESQRLYNTLGIINYETGNYRQAKHYFQKALDILSRANPSFTDLFVNYKINLAQIHFRLQEYKEATRIY